MKRLVTASILACVGAFVACAVEEPAPVNPDDGLTGGTGFGGAAGSTVSGGTGNTPQGGQGGSTPSGGTAGVGMGGTPPTGGSAGDGMGGMSGSGNVGGMTGGVAGSGNAGGMTGGSAGAGGMTGGSGGMTGGAAGAPGGAGAGGMACASITELFPMTQLTGANGQPSPANTMGSLEGYLIYTPCAPTDCDDCGGDGWYFKGVRTGCSGALDAVQSFRVGGVAGQNYRVTLHFYGVAEPKNYGNQITREAGSMRPNQDAAGSTPPGFAYATGNPTYQGSDYNTYEIHVVDNNDMEVCSYFLNSDTSEGHWTYLLNYERTINVIGGGEVRIRVYDRNCRMIKNCMAGGQQGSCTPTGCDTKARSVTQVSQASPPPPTGAPMGLDQPNLGKGTGEAGQWLYIDVTEVECATSRPANCAPL